MKSKLLLTIFFSSQVMAANVDRSFEARINDACVASVEVGGRKIPNYRDVCKCIGETHYKSALQEPRQREANAHMNWTVEFYETIDLKRLQKLVDQNPKFSSFDDQVVDDCLESVNSGKRK